MGEGAVGGASVVLILLGLIIWIVKRIVNAGLKNMDANTKAIEINTGATRALTVTLSETIAVQNERDREREKQLDRIEQKVEKLFGRRRGDTD